VAEEKAPPQEQQGTGKVDLSDAAAIAKPAKEAPVRQGLAPGVTLNRSNPTTYTMYYPLPQSYTETFALLRLDRAYVAAAGGGVAAAVHTAAGWLAAIPAVGPAVGGLLELAAGYYSAESLNADGSVTVQIAYHYCGTKAGGVDPTAIWGVDANQWFATVNGLLGAAH
jgi:hypothetical protein